MKMPILYYTAAVKLCVLSLIPRYEAIIYSKSGWDDVEYFKISNFYAIRDE